MTTVWKPEVGLELLDECMDNAFKRVSGIFDYKVTMDRSNMNVFKKTVVNIAEIGVNPGPLFMKLGEGLMEIGSYRPKHGLSLKEMAAELLTEFFNEGNAAFQAARVRLYAEAENFLKNNELDADRRKAVLAAAEETFTPPDKSELTAIALPYIKQTGSPATWTCVGGFGGLAAMIALLRHPVAGMIGAAAGTGVSYYLSRGKMCRRAELLLRKLPPDIYNSLRRDFSANISRYQDTINAALKS